MDFLNDVAVSDNRLCSSFLSHATFLSLSSTPLEVPPLARQVFCVDIFAHRHYQTQSPLGGGKRHLPNSCAADYLGASPIGGDIKRRKRELVDLKRQSPVQSGRNLYRSPESAIAKVSQHRAVSQHSAEILKTRPELSLFPNAYSSPLPHAAVPIAVPPIQLPSSGNTPDLLVGAQGSSVTDFRREPPLLSGQHPVEHSKVLTPRSILASGSNQAGEQRQELDRHLDPISPQQFTWASESIISGAYGGDIFDPLSVQPSDAGASRSLAFPITDIYPVQDSTQRQLSHESVARFSEYPFLGPWSQHQSIPLLEQDSCEAQVNMAITHSSFRITVPAPKALNLLPHGNEETEDKEQQYDNADAEYVIVSANPTLSGHQVAASLPGQVEKTPDVENAQTVQGLDLDAEPQIGVDSSWDIIAPGQNLDDNSLEDEDDEDDNDDDNEQDNGQAQSASARRAGATGSLDDAENPASTCRMPKKRQTFNEIDRQETSRTRNIGACLRCKMQRIRVSYVRLVNTNLKVTFTELKSATRTQRTQRGRVLPAKKFRRPPRR